MRHHTKDKGDIGVGFVIADLMSNGIHIALPISEHLPFDCIAISPAGALCKLSIKYREARHGRVEVRFRSNWADSQGTYSRAQDKSLFDATAIFCPDTGSCYYMNNDEVQTNTIVIRVLPPKNNQKKNVHFGEDYRNPARLFNQA